MPKVSFNSEYGVRQSYVMCLESFNDLNFRKQKIIDWDPPRVGCKMAAL